MEANAHHPPPPEKFTFNAHGRKGIDLLFFPELSCLKMTVQYSSFVLGDIMDKLYGLGLPHRETVAITEEELEEMLYR